MPAEGSFQKAAMKAALQQNMWDPVNKVQLEGTNFINK
jgi:hypothetical protein